MKNLARAIGLEAKYQEYRRLVPGYISRQEFYSEMRKILWGKLYKWPSTSPASAS